VRAQAAKQLPGGLRVILDNAVLIPEVRVVSGESGRGSLDEVYEVSAFGLGIHVIHRPE